MSSIKILRSSEAPPVVGGAYRHYLAGNIYGPDTDPPATPRLVQRALAEGWGILWPPAAEPVETVGTATPGAADLLLSLGPLPPNTYLVGTHDLSVELFPADKPAVPVLEPQEGAPEAQGPDVQLAPPEAQGPDVQLAPPEAPETPTSGGVKSNQPRPHKRGGR